MKETVAAFEARTGLRYEPASAGRPLAPGEACPTLFRYPGPEGLHDFLNGRLRRLAPADRGEVWLARDPRGKGGQPEAVHLFGSVALLEPLRLSPCVGPERGSYLGANALLRGLAGPAWVPPSLVRARVPWDRLRTAEELEGHSRAPLDGERARVLEALDRYLEELAELRRAGVPASEKPWCETPRRKRRALLERHGIRPSWTEA